MVKSVAFMTWHCKNPFLCCNHWDTCFACHSTPLLWSWRLLSAHKFWGHCSDMGHIDVWDRVIWCDFNCCCQVCSGMHHGEGWGGWTTRGVARELLSHMALCWHQKQWPSFQYWMCSLSVSFLNEAWVIMIGFRPVWTDYFSVMTMIQRCVIVLVMDLRCQSAGVSHVCYMTHS